MTLTFEKIEGARLAETSARRVIREAVEYVAYTAQIGVLCGSVGVGKSTAVRSTLRTTHPEHVWVALPSAYSPRDLVGWLHRNIVGPDFSGLVQRDLQDDLIAELTTNPRPVVIANAERLTKEAAGQLEWLHTLSPGWPLFLVGVTGTRELISTEPHLQAQVSAHIEVRPLSTNELLHVLPNIHDLFFTASRELIVNLDSYFKGNLGEWMKFLQSCQTLNRMALARGREPLPLNSELAKAALHQIRPRTTTTGSTQ